MPLARSQTPSHANWPISVAVLGFDGVNALDLVGPLETLTEARAHGGPDYRIEIVALSGLEFRSESGVIFRAGGKASLNAIYDTIIVPGGAGLREPRNLDAAAAWCRKQALTARRVVSVCTGAYALAAAGLLDGRRVTTHWRFMTDLVRRHPAIRPESGALYVKDGPIYTSGGITAGMDLALALIEEDCNSRTALAVARELVMFLKRPGGQTQFSEPLAMQMRAGDRLADLVVEMRSALKSDLRGEVLAAKAGMSPRHFSRVFTRKIGETPARHVESLRIAAARERLESSDDLIATIAADVGFASDDAFSRAFERRLGVRPEAYRQRFKLRPPNVGKVLKG